MVIVVKRNVSEWMKILIPNIVVILKLVRLRTFTELFVFSRKTFQIPDYLQTNLKL